VNDAQQDAKPCILIVEDEFLVGQAIENGVRSRGWDVAGPADELSAVVALAREARLDAAVLDVNVGGRLVWPVAAVLRERGVPFLFLTGYSQSQVTHPDFGTAPTLGKPFSERDLLAHIARLLEARGCVAADKPAGPVEGQ